MIVKWRVRFRIVVRARGSCGAHLAATSRVVAVCSQVLLDSKIVVAQLHQDRRL